MRNFISILFLSLFALTAIAQQQITTYYPPDYRIKKEVYTILDGDSSMIDGKYTKYFEDGAIAVNGEFIKGKPSGIFTEYYENGNVLSKTTYENGLKTGAFEILSKTGKKIQKGGYVEGELNGLVNGYFEDGTIKTKTNFN